MGQLQDTAAAPTGGGASITEYATIALADADRGNLVDGFVQITGLPGALFEVVSGAWAGGHPLEQMEIPANKIGPLAGGYGLKALSGSLTYDVDGYPILDEGDDEICVVQYIGVTWEYPGGVYVEIERTTPASWATADKAGIGFAQVGDDVSALLGPVLFSRHHKQTIVHALGGTTAVPTYNNGSSISISNAVTKMGMTLTRDDAFAYPGVVHEATSGVATDHDRSNLVLHGTLTGWNSGVASPNDHVLMLAVTGDYSCKYKALRVYPDVWA